MVYNNGIFLNKRLKQVIYSKYEKDENPKQKIHGKENLNINISLSSLKKRIKIKTPVLHKLSIKSNLPKLSILSY